MTRSQLREEIFKGLFLTGFHEDDEMTDQMRLFIDAEQTKIPDEDEDELPAMRSEDASYAEDKISDILVHREELDAMIDDASDRWSIDRMNKVDLTILRLASYEIKFEGVDVGIAINEAVELAKKYGEDQSYKFVNGVLGKIVRTE